MQPIWFWITFVALGLSICYVGLQPLSSPLSRYKHGWVLFYAISIVGGLAGGYLQGKAIFALSLFFSAAYASRLSRGSWMKYAAVAVTVVLALALALHLVPGFNNPILLDKVQASPSSSPFTQYVNFDKASVGLVFLLLFCKHSASRSEVSSKLQQAIRPLLAIVALIVLTAWGIGFIKPDVKLPSFTLAFMTTNLLFACIPEEGFFRGYLQEAFSRQFANTRHGEIIAIGLSGGSFGVAHLAGGLPYFLLATLAGLGYAYLYSATRRIEIPMLAHFLVNAVHFVGFTYPHAV